MIDIKFTNTPSDVAFIPLKVVSGDGAKTIAYITKEGKMFFRGKEIKTETEFRGLVLEFTDTPLPDPLYAAEERDGK